MMVFKRKSIGYEIVTLAITFLVLLTFFYLTSCQSWLYKEMPYVTTDTAYYRGDTVIVEGSVIDIGTGIEKYGHCWSTSKSPSINGERTIYENPDNTGKFTSQIILNNREENYVRSYAESDGEVIYGDTISIITAPRVIICLSPTDTSTFKMERTYIIKWYSNINDNLNIYLYKSGNYLLNIALSIPNIGFFEWKVPEYLESSNKYQLFFSNSSGSTTGQSTYFTIKAINYLEIPLVKIEGGTFEMGSNTGNKDEDPVHTVTLQPFSIGKFEVTNFDYTFFLNEYGGDIIKSGFYVGKSMISIGSSYKDERCRIRKSETGYYVQAGYEDYPVIFITWYGAYEFARFYGYRLPTEAEWEFSAKGGFKSKNYLYSGSNSPGEVGWSSINSGNEVHIIGELKPNELGIYDMSGNVWEWCSDWYREDYYEYCPEENPLGPFLGETKVRRGGCWDVEENSLRVTQRANSQPVESFSVVGFRVVLE